VRRAALAAIGALAACRATPAVDLVLVNGKVITVDSTDRIAEAIAVRGDRIVAVGTTAEVERLVGKTTRRIDLAGKAVTPGLIDAHAHFLMGATDRLNHRRRLPGNP